LTQSLIRQMLPQLF